MDAAFSVDSPFSPVAGDKRKCWIENATTLWFSMKHWHSSEWTAGFIIATVSNDQTGCHGYAVTCPAPGPMAKQLMLMGPSSVAMATRVISVACFQSCFYFSRQVTAWAGHFHSASVDVLSCLQMIFSHWPVRVFRGVPFKAVAPIVFICKRSSRTQLFLSLFAANRSAKFDEILFQCLVIGQWYVRHFV